MIALLLATLHTAQAQDVWPRGDAIDNAAAAQLTPAGLNHIAEVAVASFPAQMAVPPTSGGAPSGSFPGCLTDYYYEVNGMWVGLHPTNAQLIPSDGELLLVLDADVSVNDATQPFSMFYDAVCLDGTCTGYVAPFPIHIEAPVSLQVTQPLNPNLPIDVTVGNIDLVLPPALGSYIKMQSGCLSSIENLLQMAGMSLYGLLTDLLEPVLLDQVNSFGADIEAQLESALVATVYQSQLDVLGRPLDLQLYPTDITTNPNGVQITMGGSMSMEQDACVAPYGSHGSPKTATPVPSLAGLPAGSEILLQLSDDIVNQAFWSVWDGGIFCFTLPDPTGQAAVDLPIPLNTTLLTLLAGDAFNELFPESQDLTLSTDPRRAPYLDLASAHDLEVDVRELGLDFYGELDYRQARVLGVTLEADVAVDIAFDSSTGDIGVDVDLSGDALRTVVTGNELVPMASEDIATNLDNLLGTVIENLAGDALSGLSYTLGSSNGLGLSRLDFHTSGLEGDWLTGDAAVGQVTYGEGAGCDCAGGTAGCSAGGTTSGSAWVLGALLLWRRRRVA